MANPGSGADHQPSAGTELPRGPTGEAQHFEIGILADSVEGPQFPGSGRMDPLRSLGVTPMSLSLGDAIDDGNATIPTPDVRGAEEIDGQPSPSEGTPQHSFAFHRSIGNTVDRGNIPPPETARWSDAAGVIDGCPPPMAQAESSAAVVVIDLAESSMEELDDLTEEPPEGVASQEPGRPVVGDLHADGGSHLGGSTAWGVPSRTALWDGVGGGSTIPAAVAQSPRQWKDAQGVQRTADDGPHTPAASRKLFSQTPQEREQRVRVSVSASVEGGRGHFPDPSLAVATGGVRVQLKGSQLVGAREEDSGSRSSGGGDPLRIGGDPCPPGSSGGLTPAHVTAKPLAQKARDGLSPPLQKGDPRFQGSAVTLIRGILSERK
jgi:hypothetical protein